MVPITHHETAAGQGFSQARLSSGPLVMSVLTLGAATRSIRFDGTETLLGHSDIDRYQDNPSYLGAIVGRVANRIANAVFQMDGRTYSVTKNWHGHSLHGGTDGFSSRNWTMEPDSAANTVRLTMRSPDGDQGFPGTVDVAVDISVTADTITYDMTATPDRRTPISLAQHNYYLSRALDMELQVDASGYTPTDDDLIPTGKIAPVSGYFDLTAFRSLTEMARLDQNIDANLVPAGNGMRRMATLRSPGHFQMDVESDMLGLQVYTGHWLTEPFTRCDAVCLEPQYFPNALNTLGFGDILHTPDRPYRQTTRLRYRKL